MTLPTNIATQLQYLLEALGRQGERHLSVVETDLHQTAYLLKEAIDKLTRSFIGIHDAVTAQQVLMHRLADGAAMTPDLRAALVESHESSKAHVDSAITALQFHDMTGQLIGRIVDHVQSLHAVLATVGASSSALTADTDAAAVLTVLAEVNRILVEKGETFDHVARKTVSQTHMESGDIELF